MHLRTNAPQPGKPIDCEAMKASGFRNAGIFVVDVNDARLDSFERQFLLNLGNRFYGPKAS